MAAKPNPGAADRARGVIERCDLLARFSEEENRLTRPYGSPALRSAQHTVAGWMAATGMTVRRDAVGNLIGRYETAGQKANVQDNVSDQPRLPPLLIGGHLDTVREAGKYDGTLGVLLGIACVERLHESNETLPFPIEIVAFADEEGLRFHTAYLGSWSFTGTLDPALLERTDVDGVTLAQAIHEFGGDPASVAAGAWDDREYRGFIEAHIEQGPVLEAKGLPVGVVTAIAGQTRLAVTYAGEAGHAGTVPMELRRDALCAAAEFVLSVEEIGRTTAGLVATVGQLTAEPGASNVVPGRVRLTLDVRHQSDAIRMDAIEALLNRAVAIAQARRITVSFDRRNDAPAVACNVDLTTRLQQAISDSGRQVHRLVSGAGHDAVALSIRMPVAMLFVRCAGGVSHNPAESVAVDDVAAAIEVLERFIDGVT